MPAISEVFVKQFGLEVKHQYQQEKPKIVGATRVHRNVVGSTYDFPKLAKLTANQRSARNADLTALSPNHTKVTATLADWYAPVYLDDLDQLKTNVDYRREYVQASAAAIARKQDEIVVAALDAATMETGHAIADGNTGLTVAKLNAASKLLHLQDVPMGERFLVVSPQQIEDALNTAQFTSTDYNIANTMQGLMTGTISKAFGFNWIISSELSADANDIRSCYAFDRRAIGTAIGADMTTKINYSVDKDAWLVLSKTSLGVAVVDTFGVVRIGCDETPD